MPERSWSFSISQSLYLNVIDIGIENFRFHFYERHQIDSICHLFEARMLTAKFFLFVRSIIAVSADTDIDQNIHCIGHIDVQIGGSCFLCCLARQLTWNESILISVHKVSPMSYCKRCRALVRDRAWLNTTVIVPRYSSHLHGRSRHHGYTTVLYIHLNETNEEKGGERRSALLKGIFIIRSCSSVGKTEAKSFFVGQSFSLRIRGRPPCSSSFKRTNRRRAIDFLSCHSFRFAYFLDTRNRPKIVLI